MQPNENAEGNRTPEVDPPIKHTVAWRVTFVDGTSGEIEMAAFLRNPDLNGTIFEPLRDPRSSPRLKSCSARFSGRTEPTLRQMRCTTLFVNGVSGFLIE
jgi:hypothetical protein